MKNKNLILTVTIGIFILTSIVVVFGLINQWFGLPREGVMQFCEFARDGLIKQPANSYSNLAFTFVGLYIAWYAYYNKFSAQNLMSTEAIFPILYATGLIITGAGSFAMHASNAYWGGFLDLFGMFLIASFAVTYSLKRLLRFSNLVFLAMYSISVIISSYIFLSPFNHSAIFVSWAELIFGFELLASIAIELYLIYVRKVQLKAKYGWYCVGALTLAFTIWNLSRYEESVLCNPHSLLQGHAAWHILDAFAGLFAFLYFASETNPVE